MREMIEKAKNRIKKIDKLKAKELALDTVLPLFMEMQDQIDELSARPFDISEVFIEQTGRMVGAHNEMMTKVLLAAGFFVENPEPTSPDDVILVSDQMPMQLQAEYQQLQQAQLEWLELFAEFKETMESYEDAEEDGDEEDEDEGGDVAASDTTNSTNNDATDPALAATKEGRAPAESDAEVEQNNTQEQANA